MTITSKKKGKFSLAGQLNPTERFFFLLLLDV